MVKILFFGRLSDDLGTTEILLHLVEGSYTVKDVLDLLDEEIEGESIKSLTSGDVLVAVNHTLCDFDQEVNTGDELAFMPPVTGG